MADKYKLTVGADPEFFVINKKEKKVVPSCRRFGGEKRAPMFLSPDGGFLEDGTTVEFNLTPSSDLRQTNKKIRNLLLVFLNKYPEYVISPLSSHRFNKADLKKFPEAFQLGCAPDLFAYGARIVPSIERFGEKRFAGGHIHLGIDPWPEGLSKELIVKFMDICFLGPLLGTLADKSRWEFYGHPGLFRYTSYGVEYRSPDNHWCNPEYYAKLDISKKDYLDAVIIRVDDALAHLMDVLNIDTHGARVEKELKEFIKSLGFHTPMESLSIYKDSTELIPYQHCSNDLLWFLKGQSDGRRKEAQRRKIHKSIVS